MNRYDSTTRINREVVKRHHEINFTSHVVVPFTIATLLTIAAAIAVQAGTQPYAPKPPAWLAFGLWFVIFCGVFYIVLETGGDIEIITGYDLNGDGFVGPPPEAKDPYQTQLHIDWDNLPNQAGRQTQLPHFKPPPETVMRLFQMALDNDRRGDAIIPDNHVVKGLKIIGGDDWKELMSTLRELKWAKYIGDYYKNGHELTDKGRAAMEAEVEKWFMSNK